MEGLDVTLLLSAKSPGAKRYKGVFDGCRVDQAQLYVGRPTSGNCRNRLGAGDSARELCRALTNCFPGSAERIASYRNANLDGVRETKNVSFSAMPRPYEW